MRATKNNDQDPKWGFWDITDEQAEKINNGDIDEFNRFFMLNYDVIEKLCYDKLKKLSAIYQSEKDVHDIINAYYYDLRFAKFESGALLCHLLYMSARSVDRSSYKIAEKLSPYTLFDSFKNTPYFQSFEYDNANEDGDTFVLADFYETAPSPQEEIDNEEKRAHIPRLIKAISPLFTPKAQNYLEYFLNGIKPAHADQRMNTHGGASVYTQIKRTLALNYQEVLKILTDNGYQIPPYLQNALPDKYEEYIAPKLERERKRELKQQEQRAEKERKLRERAERARTRKERLREYNREYKRRQRAQAKTASASETA